MAIVAQPDWKFALTPAAFEHGGVNIVALDTIKESTGARWSKTRPAICARFEALLRRILAPTDFFAELDDTSYLISTPAATAEEAQVFCLQAVYELHQSLFGQFHIGDVRIARATEFKDGKLECAPLNTEILIGLASKSGLKCAPSSGSVIRPDMARLADRVSIDPIKFVPVWDVQNEAITTYRCISPNEPTHSEVFAPQARLKVELTALLCRISVAANSLATHLRTGQRFLLSVPISYELWGAPIARMEVASLCRSLSAELRPYLLFEITDMPYGVPQSRLSELVGSLRPFCRGVCAHLPPRISNYGAYQGAGLYAICLTLSPQVVGATEMESEVFKLCSAAKRLHIKSFVLDVPTLEILLSARDLGANFVCGSLIGQPLEQPAPIHRLTVKDFLPRAAVDSSRELRQAG